MPPASAPIPLEAGGMPLLPGEYEPVDNVLFGWSEDAWGYTPTFSTLVRETSYRSKVTVLHSSATDLKPLRLELQHAGANLEAITFVQTPLDSMWMRDYGPFVVRSPSRAREVVDFNYSRANDDIVPQVFAQQTQLATHTLPIEIEGGHLQADGTGRCILSEDAILRNRDLGIVDGEVERLLRQHLGCQTLVIVPVLYGEETGHIDIFLYVTGPGHVLLGRYRNDEDGYNARRLERTARLLRKAGFTISRVPMPSNRRRRIFRTYTNALAVEDAIFVPVYRSERRYERVALRAFERAFPTRIVIPIEADEISELGGAIHCIAMTVAK